MAQLPRPVPLAYLLTFTCYGTWLHGRETGSVDAGHNRFGEPFLPADPGLESRHRERMTEPEFVLDTPRRQVVLATLQEVSRHRGWHLLAAHVRPRHVHCVVQADCDPDKILDDFKAYATRRLKEKGFDLERKKRWTEGGSTRFLWRADRVRHAVHYVVEEQGEPMEVFAATDGQSP